MKKVLAVVLAVAFVSIGAINADAQTPNIQIYFNQNLSVTQGLCPGAPVGTVFDKAYVVANNFNAWLSAIEFGVVYPPSMAWLGDAFPPEGVANAWLQLGSTPGGIALSFPIPVNGFVAAVVMEVNFLWMCDTCDGFLNDQLIVTPSGMTGAIRGVQWPTNTLIPAIGQTSLVCADVPVEVKTWGGIKALYE
jgi:MFS family permease